MAYLAFPPQKSAVSFATITSSDGVSTLHIIIYIVVFVLVFVVVIVPYGLYTPGQFIQSL